MPPRRIRKLNGSTDQSLRWLNFAGRSERRERPEGAAQELPDPKKRRATLDTGVYDLPVSPEEPQRTRADRRLRARQARTRQTPAPEASPEPSSSEDDKEPSDAESQSDTRESESNDEPAPIGIQHNVKNNMEVEDDQTGSGGGRDSPGTDSSSSESEDESVPFPRELLFYHDEDHDSTGNNGVKDAAHEIGSQFEAETSGSDESESGVENVPDTQPLTDTLASTRLDNPLAQIQIPKSSAEDQTERPPLNDEPRDDSPPSQVDLMVFQEVPETPVPSTPTVPLIEVYTRPPHAIFSWLTETIENSGFREAWEAIRQIRSVKQGADSSMKGYFTNIKRMKARLQNLYQTMAEDASSLPMRDGWGRECSLIANNVFKEIQWMIFDEAQFDEKRGADVVNQLEAHVVPWLIELVFFGFRAYKARGDSAKRHFRISLDLLYGCSYKIACFADLPHDVGRGVFALSRSVMIPVKTIKDALDDGRLQEKGRMRHNIPYKHFRLHEVESRIACGPWNRKEKDALRNAYESAVLDGLQGDDLYVQIKCDPEYGFSLSERLLQHVREQAHKLGLDD